MAGEGRRGCGTVAAIVLVVAIVAGATGYVLWKRYVASPQYATLKAMQAVSWRDYDEFSRWVDVDAVVTSVVESATPGGAVPPPGVREALADSAEAAVRQRITQGVAGVPRDVPFAALVFGDVVKDTRVTGDDAYVTAETASGGRGMRFELRLRRQGGAWRVVELRNASELLLQGVSGSTGTRPARLIYCRSPRSAPAMSPSGGMADTLA